MIVCSDGSKKKEEKDGDEAGSGASVRKEPNLSKMLKTGSTFVSWKPFNVQCQRSQTIPKRVGKMYRHHHQVHSVVDRVMVVRVRGGNSFQLQLQDQLQS